MRRDLKITVIYKGIHGWALTDFNHFINQNMIKDNKPFFAPELFITNGVRDVSFYEKAFGATEQMRFSNDDGSIHVVELSIEGAIFHIHEITATQHFFSLRKTTALQFVSAYLFLTWEK